MHLPQWLTRALRRDRPLGPAKPPPLPTHLQRPPDPWALTRVLMSFSDYDHLTIGDDMANTAVLGGNGSGKTSGVARQLRLARLYLGYGMAFFSSKQSDVREFLGLCREAGRLDDVILLGDGDARFNFLDYISGVVEETVNTLMTCSEVLDRGAAGGGGGGDNGKFFHLATKAMFRGCVSVMRLAGEPVTIPKIMKAIRTAPTSMDQVRSDGFKAESYLMHLLKRADEAGKTPMQRRDFEVDLDFWLEEHPRTPERTRGSTIATVSGICDPLMRGQARELLCTDTTFDPAWLFERGTILVNTMSVKEHGASGLLVQAIIKHTVQKALERRDVIQHPRPVSLDLDEFQTLITSGDAAFAATCRSQRAALFLLTQNLPTVYAALGAGDKAKQEVDSILGNCATKILCANSCAVTNQWAADLIGRCKQFMVNANNSYGDEDAASLLFGGGSARMSAGVNEVMDYDLQPAFWAHGLRTGGPANDWSVDAIAFRNGAKFRANGKNWMQVTFPQR